MEEELANVTFLLYKDLQNAAQIHKMLSSGDLRVAVVNPEMVYHCDQLLLAAHRSLYNDRHGQLKTRSVFTELLYSMFPSRSIRDALKTLGLQSNGGAALFVLFNGHNCSSQAEVEDAVRGESVSLDSIACLRDTKAIRRLYKVPESITDEEDVLNFILTRMATKELLL